MPEIRLMLRRLLVLSVCLMLSATAGSAKKLALVIGIDEYNNLENLDKAVEDASGYRALFEDNGFDVTYLENSNTGEMNYAIATFLSRIERGDTVVFTYSGHGWSDGTLNYLIPGDMPMLSNTVQTANLSIVVKDGVSGIIDKIAARGARLTLAIIDACRDNPFLNAEVRSFGLNGGLAPTEAPSGTFIVYSAAAAQQALDQIGDNDPKTYSVFTRYFIPNLRSTGDIRRAVLRTRQEVLAAAGRVGHNQRPAYYDELTSNSCLFSNCIPDDGGPAQVAPDPAEVAAGLWDFIKNTTDTQVLRSFVKDHGAAAPKLERLANRRIAALEARAKAEAEAARSDPTPAPAPDKPEKTVETEITSNSLADQLLGNKGTGMPGKPPLPSEPVAMTWLTRGPTAASVAACDRVAAHPENEDNAPSIKGKFAIISGVEEAVRLCQRAVDRNPDSKRALYQLGLAHYWRRAPEDWATAQELFTKAANKNYPPALMMLGNMHYMGQGVAQDHKRALSYYDEAARGGHAIAAAALSFMYFTGQGLDKPNPFTGIYYMRSAAENPTPTARIYIGAVGLYVEDLEINTNQAVSILESAGIEGHYLAYDLLGEAFEHGTPHVRKDTSRALGYFRRAANLGSPTANSKLGFYYANGWGVDKDLRTAVRFYRHGASRNDPVSMLELAKLYRKGTYLQRDNVKAAELLLKATQLGSAEAPALLSLMHETGQGVDPSNYMAAAYMLLSLDRGSTYLLNQTNQTISRELVMEMQRQMKTIGYYAGPIDGTMSQTLKGSLKEYCDCG